jgi:hypothetical protein
MKKFLAIVVLVLIGAGAFFVLKSKNSPATNLPAIAAETGDSAKNSQSQAPAVAAPSVPAPTRTESPTANPTTSPTSDTAASVPPQAPTEAQGLPPQVVLDNARVAMHNYNSAFGENPVGDNSEITAALMGKNPKQSNFITTESGLRVNAKGEMIDAWGTPFFFHQLSGQVMEIRSAGEDRKMWTSDDQVTR